MRRFAPTLIVALLALPLAAAAEDREITLETLLKEMVDRDAVARFPDPPYKCMQASSYDRKSKTPDDAAGWFANHDWSNFLRSEENKGRIEWVLMDADGALAPKPLSMEYAKAPADSPGGMNLYLPIPYAKHCKVTYSEPDAKDYDVYSKEAKAWGPVELGVFEPKDGKMILRVEVVGANPDAKGTKSYFGLDCVVLSAP